MLLLLAVAAVGSLNALEEVISLVNGAPKKKGEIAKEEEKCRWRKSER